MASGNQPFKRVKYGNKVPDHPALPQRLPAAPPRTKTFVEARSTIKAGNKPKVIRYLSEAKQRQRLTALRVLRNRSSTSQPTRVVLPKAPSSWDHVLATVTDKVILNTGAVRKVTHMPATSLITSNLAVLDGGPFAA